MGGRGSSSAFRVVTSDVAQAAVLPSLPAGNLSCSQPAGMSAAFQAALVLLCLAWPAQALTAALPFLLPPEALGRLGLVNCFISVLLFNEVTACRADGAF